jgi:hypothetical protein
MGRTKDRELGLEAIENVLYVFSVRGGTGRTWVSEGLARELGRTMDVSLFSVGLPEHPMPAPQHAT